MPDNFPKAVAPKRQRCAGRMAVALELVLAAFLGRLLHLDDGVRDSGTVEVKHHDVRALG